MTTPASDRYEIRHTLGAGGMGVVYAAFDSVRGELVALKTLRRLDPAAVYRFKREFRAIADAAHPNLVSLHELVAEGDQCYFTMELVDGTTFLNSVTRDPTDVTADVSDDGDDDLGSLAQRVVARLEIPEVSSRGPVDPLGDTASEGEPDPLQYRTQPEAARTRGYRPAEDGATAPPPGASRPPIHGSMAPEADRATEPRMRALPDPTPRHRFDEPRLRHGLRQLVDGVMQLHSLGLIHRDLKATNVLVTDKGRLVILDLGLVTWTNAADASVERYVAGTAAYMSPEQSIAGPVTEATDWYAVGVMLYEALTGQRPFRGSFEQIVAAKQAGGPTPPELLADRLPGDLSRLCMDLLAFKPDDRPTGPQIIERLGDPGPLPEAHDETGFAVPVLVSSGPSTAFVGRDGQLDVLRRSYQQAVLGRTVAVHAHGPSGMGKSTVLRRFLDEVADNRDGAVVLSGRCYERESVPYKGFDGVVDSLSRYLRSVGRDNADALLPRAVHELARVFPVLRQVEAVALAKGRLAEGLDPHEVRRRAFRGLRDLLARIGDRRPLVICIDDLQWGDLDSARLIADLLRPPEQPSLLLIASYRSDEVEASGHLRALRGAQGLVSVPDGRPCRVDLGPGCEVLELPVGPLDGAECLELAGSLLGPRDDSEDRRAIEIATESRGNPFFVHELVRHLQLREQRRSRAAAEDRSEPSDFPRGEDLGRLRVEDMLRERLALLPPAARDLAEIVAVAGRPLPRGVLIAAAGLQTEHLAAIEQLRAAHVIRTRELGVEPALEPYHDRIRESIVGELPGHRLRSRHLSLALALEGSRHADPEALAEHFCGAGHLEKAGDYAVRAAREAGEALAFDRAAMLYRFAMRLLGSGSSGSEALQEPLGEALAQAGRSHEAAAVFAGCAARATGSRALELQVRAAEEFLRSGHVDEGMTALRGVLTAVGMRLPEGPRGAIASLLLRRGRLGVRGLGWKSTDASELAPIERTRIDACWAVASGLGLIDPIRGGDFQTRGLHMALDAGEPFRVARSLAMEASYHATAGEKGRAKAQRILADAAAVAEQRDDHYLRGLTLFASALTAYQGGQWARARQLSEEAEARYLEHCSGVSLEVASNRHFHVLALLQLGELRELARSIPMYVEDAEARGDRFTTTSFRNGCMNIAWLLRDDPDGAAEAVREALAPWSPDTFLLQHYEGLYADTHILLYRGDGAAAWRRVEQDWPALRRSMLLQIQQLKLEALFFRGRAALAAAVSGGEGVPPARTLLAEATRLAGRIESERMAWSDPLARVLRAGVAHLSGDRAGAIVGLDGAVAALDGQQMRLYAAAARWMRGHLLGGSEGGTAVQLADDWFASESVQNPAAMAACFAPGFVAG